jgi:hypothetical protein
MSKVAIYKFDFYDVNSDGYLKIGVDMPKRFR